MKSVNDLDLCTYYLVYVAFIGEDLDGRNIYHLLFSQDIENTFMDGWSEKPACNIANSTLMLDEEQYELTKVLKTDISLDLAQDNCCYSMQDCRDGIVAIASENLDDAEFYPEEGRIVLAFGDTLTKVEDILSKRGLPLVDRI